MSSSDGKSIVHGEPNTCDAFPLLQNDTPERAAEIFRLGLQQLSRFQAPPIPLNYALCYFYSAGTDLRLREKMDAVLGGGWQFEVARDLFLRFLTPCNDVSMAELQKELLVLINGVVESAVNTNRSTVQHTEALDRQIDRLEDCQDPKQALQIANEVLNEARLLANDSLMLASDMQDAAGEIVRLKEELMHARREASVDPLTGLSNRRTFDSTLLNLVAVDEPFTLIMMDVDHFKRINDEHGHLVGDRVLRQLAKLVSARTRATDVVSRYGGEEFAILLPRTRIYEGKQIAEKMRSGIGGMNMRRTDTGVQLGRVTSSFGVAEYQRGEAIEALIARADSALYSAKRNGRDRVELSSQVVA